MMLAESCRTAVCAPEIALGLPGLAPSYLPPAMIADTRRVFVDQGLTLRGAFGGCDHLAIAGHVESDVAMRILDILEEGSFKGSAIVDEAHIAGRYEGVLKVAETLVVGPSAHIFGSVECGRLQLEDGGRIEGELRVLAQEADEVPGTDDDDAALDALFIEAAPATEADADEAPIASGPIAHKSASTAGDSDSLLQSAAVIEDSARLAEAEATFQAALKKNACDVAALSGLGHLARQRGDLTGALHYFEMIMAVDTGNVSVRCVSIDILHALSRHDEAEAMAKTVSSIRAQPLSTTSGEEAEDVATPGFDEAEAMFKSVLARHPRNLGALAGLGHLSRRRGDRAAMREYYLAALAVEPANVNLRVEIARAFKEQGDVGLARDILETVLTEQWGERDFART